ncbi:MAG: hypothetical protein JW885_11120 [Deltaproteobacteria bacterium]|nr:hypothetical protein [Candidatus Zymogenaceae bacterium]
MRLDRFQIILIASLILTSCALYTLHFFVFHDAHHIFIYMLGDIAVMPIEVLVVTLIIHRMLQMRERGALMTKLNMVIGAFYSEMGISLIQTVSTIDLSIDAIRDDILTGHDWSDSQVGRIKAILDSYFPDIEIGMCNLPLLKEFLLGKREFLLRLLENPNLLEHETFTDLLWAVSHLQEELYFREDFSILPKSDLAHLTLDIKRAYLLLLKEWVVYMRHLRKNYPYLFSLAVRLNPFDTEASVVVREAPLDD